MCVANYIKHDISNLNYSAEEVLPFGLVNATNVNTGSDVTFQPEIKLFSGVK